jgi:8-amino-3,8-dideoxy-alpha-D-manno-octulosonate transaminase
MALRAACVFAECDDSFGLDPGDVAGRITRRTRAIMPVHLGGVACRMVELLAVARPRGVGVIEDCAQSAGASHQGRPVGSIGDVGAFSFQMQKIVTAGEGGWSPPAIRCSTSAPSATPTTGATATAARAPVSDSSGSWP